MVRYGIEHKKRRLIWTSFFISVTERIIREHYYTDVVFIQEKCFFVFQFGNRFVLHSSSSHTHTATVFFNLL